MQNLEDTYNKIAKDWHEDHKGDTWWTASTDEFIRRLTPGSLVLDVGCGSGLKSRYLNERSLRTIGIDISAKMIELARREMPGGDFRVLDMRSISRMSEEFDAIFTQASLLHIPKAEAPGILKRFLPKLKKGGLVYVALKKVKEDGKDEDVLQENDYGYEYERFFSYYTTAEVRKLLTDSGLTVLYEQETKTGPGGWVIMIAKK